MNRLNDISKIDVGFPRDFLESDDVRELIFGKTFPLIDSGKGYEV
jgi:hypothetical protein